MFSSAIGLFTVLIGLLLFCTFKPWYFKPRHVRFIFYCFQSPFIISIAFQSLLNISNSDNFIKLCLVKATKTQDIIIIHDDQKCRKVRKFEGDSRLVDG